MTRRVHLVVGLVCVGALTACDTGISGPPEIPSSPQADLLPLISSIDDLLLLYPDAKQIAVGRADLTSILDPDVIAQKYTFNAIVNHDLSIKGQFEVHQSDFLGNVVQIHGEVSCVNNLGTIVEVGGIITKVGPHTTLDLMPGDAIVWQVQDNGEGQAAPPDLASPMNEHAGSAPGFCVAQANMLVEQDNGNIQVKRRN